MLTERRPDPNKVVTDQTHRTSAKAARSPRGVRPGMGTPGPREGLAAPNGGLMGWRSLFPPCGSWAPPAWLAWSAPCPRYWGAARVCAPLFLIVLYG